MDRHTGEVSRPCTVGRMGRKLKEGAGSEASVGVAQPRRYGHLHWPDLTFLTLDRGLIHFAGLCRPPALPVHKEVPSLSQLVGCDWVLSALQRMHPGRSVSTCQGPGRWLHTLCVVIISSLELSSKLGTKWPMAHGCCNCIWG